MMTPKISTQAQRKIEIMLASWVGKLTWHALVVRVEIELGIKTTRQTLYTYLSIKTCYQNRKSFLRGASPSLYSKITSSDVKLMQQVDNLRAEIVILKKHNAEQLRMIERMLANASLIPNIDLRDLIKMRPEELK